MCSLSHIIGNNVPDDRFQFNDDLKHFTGLPNVKYLRLEEHYIYSLPTFFTALKQNFSGVTELELSSAYFESLAEILTVHAALPLLHRLALVKVSFDDESVGLSPALYTAPSRLVDVVVDCRLLSPALRWLPSNPCLRRLAIGKLRRQDYFDLFSDVLRILGPRLEHLIIFDAHSDALPDLSHITQLRVFEITSIKCLSQYTSADLAWLPTLLSQLNSRVLERIVLIVDLASRASLDLLDWPRLAALEGVERVYFSVSINKNWARKAIDERLRARRYVLRVGQWKQWYQYGLGIFDL
ncbi:hypothetical protein FB451DRAFT_1449128 [Mycena latifolia]|nr:hypothetical protein FB451DRAFT_1449128 [Mycena latifolia]